MLCYQHINRGTSFLIRDDGRSRLMSRANTHQRTANIAVYHSTWHVSRSSNVYQRSSLERLIFMASGVCEKSKDLTRIVSAILLTAESTIIATGSGMTLREGLNSWLRNPPRSPNDCLDRVLSARHSISSKITAARRRNARRGSGGAIHSVQRQL